MTPTIDQIVHLLTKHSLGKELTLFESEQLQKWRAQSIDNEALYQNLQQADFKSKQLHILDQIIIQEEWEKFQAHINPTKRKKITPLKRLIPYAAALLIGALLVFSVKRLTLKVQKQESKIAQQHNNKEVAPAVVGAQLLLSDGSTLTLDQQTNINNKQGLSLKSVDNTLAISNTSSTATLVEQQNTLLVPKGFHYRIMLPDETKVWVNANSKLVFPTYFNQKERRVKLEGEAYFEVSHHPEQPFIVESLGTETRVLGTNFNINAYDKIVKTTLASGKVEFSVSNQKSLLTPGHQAEWKNNKLSNKPIDIQKELAWKNEEFYFMKDNIVQIAYVLSRWYDVEIKFVGDIDLDKVYSGSMSRNLPLSQVLEVLKFGADFQFEITGKELIIKESKK